MTAVSSRAASSSQCVLCSSIAEPRFAWDQPVLESKSFVAVPSLGSLVAGWLLIVPRRHFISTGAFQLDLLEELLEFKEEVCSRLSAHYGEICAFEHGPSAVKRQVGCGVDDAHIHVVPLNCDLVEAAKPYVPDVEWRQAQWSDCRRAVAQRLDYLFVEQPVGRGRIAVAEEFGSQIFRRAIDSIIGRPEEFNWRTHPHELNIDKTIQLFSLAAVGG